MNVGAGRGSRATPLNSLVPCVCVCVCVRVCVCEKGASEGRNKKWSIERLC